VPLVPAAVAGTDRLLRFGPLRVAYGSPVDIDALNRHTLAWADEVNATGLAFITPFVLDDVWAVRISVGAQPTTRADVAAAWELVRTLAEGRAARST